MKFLLDATSLLECAVESALVRRDTGKCFVKGFSDIVVAEGD